MVQIWAICSFQWKYIFFGTWPNQIVFYDRRNYFFFTFTVWRHWCLRTIEIVATYMYANNAHRSFHVWYIHEVFWNVYYIVCINNKFIYVSNNYVDNELKSRTILYYTWTNLNMLAVNKFKSLGVSSSIDHVFISKMFEFVKFLMN